MANTEWWQRGPIDGVPAVLQPIAHMLLQVQESVEELVEGLDETQWNARPAGVASAAFHVRHMAGVIDRLFTYARGESLSEAQFATRDAEGAHLPAAEVPRVLDALRQRVATALDELRSVDTNTLGDFRAVGRDKLPSTVIGSLVHGAEHAMRHVGQLSVTVRVVRQQYPGETVGPGLPQSLEAALTVQDLQKSLAWYRDILGFSIDREHAREGKLIAVSVKHGAVRLLLNQDNGARGGDRAKGEGFSLQITTTQSVDDIAARIKAAGIELAGAPADMPWGVRVLRVQDPDGFRFALSQPLQRKA